MGRKEGGAAVLLSPGKLVPRLTRCGLGRGLLPYQVVSSSIQPFGHNRHGPKIGWGAVPFFLGGKLHPHLTVWPGQRPTSMPSGNLDPSSRLAIIDTGQKLGAVPPCGERGPGPHLTQSHLGLEAYLHTKWHVNPSSHLATTDIGGKLGSSAPLGRGSWGSHLTQCGQGRGLPACQVLS